MELFSEYLAADTSPDASADALAIINIGKIYSHVAYMVHIPVPTLDTTTMIK